MIRRIFLIILLFCSINTLRAQETADPFNASNEVYFTFEVDQPELIHHLSKIISIDNVKENLQVFAYANKSEWEKFVQEGIAYEILQHPGTLIRPRMLDKVDIREIDAWDFYPTYDAYVDMMYQFENNYPGLCDVFSIGTTNEGREILVARITDYIGMDEDEPEFLFTSSIHGDETTGYVLMLRLIDYLLSGYDDDPRITTMLNEMDIYINPLANPDGSYRVGNSNIYGAIRGNANGIDLNRNYPDPEDGLHPDGNPWQTETIHFMNFAEERSFVMGSNFHGGEEVLNYPWDTWPILAADDDWWIYVCREFADTVHVHAPPTYLSGYNNGITNGYQWYTIAGGRQDYMNYFQQCREMTHEISLVKLLPASQLPAMWDYNYRSFLNYIEQAGFGLRGRITDSATGEPLEAEVFVLNHELDSSWVYSSLPEGNYHRLLNEGTYTIKYSKQGYSSQTHVNVEINNRQATVIDVELVNPFSAIDENDIPAFSIYPNPARGKLIRVRSDNDFQNIQVYDLNGKQQSILYEGNLVDISALSAGTYIMRLNIDGLFYEQKFIKR
jgi:hypothetical protein